MFIGVDLAGILGDPWRAPKVDWCHVRWVWGGVSLPQPTRESGERCQPHPPPPFSGVRAEPRPKTDLAYLEGYRTLFLYLYDKICRGEICISVSLLLILGDLSPCPPWYTSMVMLRYVDGRFSILYTVKHCDSPMSCDKERRPVVECMRESICFFVVRVRCRGTKVYVRYLISWWVFL